MSSSARPSGVQRFGYGVGAAANLVLAWLVNVWPGWEAVPFLTEDTSRIIVLVNLSLLLGVVSNVAYFWVDPPVLKALVSVVSLGISVAILVRTLRVFPFDFGENASLYEPFVEAVLILLIVLTVLGLIAQGVRLVRLLAASPDSPAN